MFSFLKEKLQKIYNQVTLTLGSIFERTTIDEKLLTELERVLLEADTGIITTRTCITYLREQIAQGAIKNGTELQASLALHLKKILHKKQYVEHGPIYLLVGVNGTGKTTCAAKLAHKFTQQGKKVVLAAADTFRAAAVDQLAIWAERTGAHLVRGAPGQDPASVVFAACQYFSQNKGDILIIDTAGRLQNKNNLMRELEKIRSVINKVLPNTQVTTLLTVDAMIGQNSLDQAQLFNVATPLDGIILTKMDGTGKGGIIFGVSQMLNIPIAYVSYGESLDQIKLFDPDIYVKELLEKS